MKQIDKLYNCDCMEFMKDMENKSVDMTLTDIPYGEVNRADNGLRSLDKDKADITTFDLETFLKEVDRVTKNVIVIFCGIEQLSGIFSFYKNKGYPIRQMIWCKSNPSPMNGDKVYLNATENAVWVKKNGAKFNAFCKPNFMNYPCGSSSFHPTEKNHDLLRQLIIENTKQGDIIFDPCSGSGSSLLVGGGEGRHFIGCELNKTYFEKAEKRLKMCGGYVPQLIGEDCYA